MSISADPDCLPRKLPEKKHQKNQKQAKHQKRGRHQKRANNNKKSKFSYH